MPNGHDKNWIRLCAAVDGFRVRHGRWPTRVHMHALSLDDLRQHVFSRPDFAKLEKKIELVAGSKTEMIAEDDCGAQYDYGKEGFPPSRPKPSAAEWLGVKPMPEED